MSSNGDIPNGLIEDAAAIALKDGCTTDRAIQLSVAISQKRIADALWGRPDTTGLLQLLNPLEIRNNY